MKFPNTPIYVLLGLAIAQPYLVYLLARGKGREPHLWVMASFCSWVAVVPAFTGGFLEGPGVIGGDFWVIMAALLFSLVPLWWLFLLPDQRKRSLRAKTAKEIEMVQALVKDTESPPGPILVRPTKPEPVVGWPPETDAEPKSFVPPWAPAFDDILHVPDRVLAVAIPGIDNGTLSVALMGASDEIMDRVLEFLDLPARKEVLMKMKLMKRFSSDAISVAQQAILTVINETP